MRQTMIDKGLIHVFDVELKPKYCCYRTLEHPSTQASTYPNAWLMVGDLDGRGELRSAVVFRHEVLSNRLTRLTSALCQPAIGSSVINLVCPGASEDPAWVPRCRFEYTHTQALQDRRFVEPPPATRLSYARIILLWRINTKTVAQYSSE